MSVAAAAMRPAEVQLAAGLASGLGTLSIELTNHIMPPFPELTVTPYERRCPAVMSMGPELVGNFFPTKSGIRPMTRERFASRMLWRCCIAWETVIL
jgi:hypothetical protein